MRLLLAKIILYPPMFFMLAIMIVVMSPILIFTWALDQLEREGK